MLFGIALGRPAEEVHQHADAEVEPFQHEEAAEQHGEENEPEFLQSHAGTPSQYANDIGPRSASSGGVGGAGSASCSSGPSTT